VRSRTAVLTVVAALSLGAAGFAAAQGRSPGSTGKPSTNPPSWSQGDSGVGHSGANPGAAKAKGH
jgi:hypothetical protein